MPRGDWIVRHPWRDVGGPQPQPQPGPAPPGSSNSQGPTQQTPTPQGPGAVEVPGLAGIISGIEAGLGAGLSNFVAGGTVLLGVALIVTGLLVASGNAGRIVRAGGRAARVAVLHGG